MDAIDVVHFAGAAGAPWTELPTSWDVELVTCSQCKAQMQLDLDAAWARGIVDAARVGRTFIVDHRQDIVSAVAAITPGDATP